MLVKCYIFAVLVVAISGLYVGTKNYSEQARYSGFKIEMKGLKR